MRCHQCAEDAIGVCSFCGRAVCQKHHKTKPLVLSVFTSNDGTPFVVAVENVLGCATCRPVPRPVRLPELMPGGAG
jgi:hypothetical protein